MKLIKLALFVDLSDLLEQLLIQHVLNLSHLVLRLSKHAGFGHFSLTLKRLRHLNVSTHPTRVSLGLFLFDLLSVLFIEELQLALGQLALMFFFFSLLSLLFLNLIVDSGHVCVFKFLLGFLFLSLDIVFGFFLLLNVFHCQRDCFCFLHLELRRNRLRIAFGNLLASLITLFQVVDALDCIVVFLCHEFFDQSAFFFKTDLSFLLPAFLIGQLLLSNVLVDFNLMLLFLFLRLLLVGN